MKTFVTLILVSACTISFAQDGAMEGIDAYLMEPGYYDDLDMAKANPDSVFYLDLSLQSPKLREIPGVVYSFKNLKYLELAYNQIGAIDDGISSLANLEVLGLNGNKYLKTVSSNVYRLASLKELHLNDTGLSSDQLDVVQKRLQDGCKVIR